MNIAIIPIILFMNLIIGSYPMLSESLEAEKAGEFWADSLNVTIRKEDHPQRGEDTWIAYADYRYGLINYSGTIGEYGIEFLNTNIGRYSDHRDYFFSGCNIEKDTIEYAHEKLPLFNNFASYDSILIIFKIYGNFEICTDSIGYGQVEIIGRFVWSDTTVAYIEH